MSSLKNAVLLGAVSLMISACGGGSADNGNETLAASVPAPVSLSPTQFDIQTKAAEDAFEQRLATAQTEANEWLESNRRASNVVTTRSGLQYKVNKSSSNPNGQRYQVDQNVTVHYKGSLIDGTVFDSSFARGRTETLNPNELIQGWQEALTLMQPGDEWTLYIPPSLGYGTLGKGNGVPSNAVLIFDVELR